MSGKYKEMILFLRIDRIWRAGEMLALEICLAPRVFTKVLALFLGGLLKTPGILLVGYLDNLLLREQSTQKMKSSRWY